VGLLSDFFLATPAEVAAADLSLGPSRAFGALEWKGVDTIWLGEMEERLTGADPGDLKQEVVREGEEWLVVQVTAGLIAAVLSMDAKDADDFAKEWLLSDDDRQLLERLPVLVREGQAKGKNVYLWLAS
jgi:hypothetical protein